MAFNVGDKVRFLHEKGEAVIVTIISAYRVRVELTEGIEIEVAASELVFVKPIPVAHVSIYAKGNLPRKPVNRISKPHAKDEIEVDLHIEALTEYAYTMNNAQKLSLQLHHFQNSLEKAIKGHIIKLVFIHGVGSGTLRQSIRDVLKRYDGIEFSDGAYNKYGAGATEVRIISKAKLKESF